MKRKIIAVLVWLVVLSLIIPAVGMNAVGEKGGNGKGNGGKGNSGAKNNYLIVESSASGVSDGAVRIRSSNGKISWEMTELNTPCEAEMLGNGNRLIAETYAMRVIEVDPLGNVVKTVSTETIYGITVLDDGNYLLAGLDGVWEVDSITGEVLWDYPLFFAYDAIKLPDNTYVITDFDSNIVLQVDIYENIIKTYTGCYGISFINPTDIDLLSNGNYLISDYNNRRTVELNPNGAPEWQYNAGGPIHDSDRLPNGNTLITDATNERVYEVDYYGKRTWQLRRLQFPNNIDLLPA
ncbi:MAG: hypothetical protein JSV09_11955 [Thermoplasmata archaeon]|nr:MAG: hypothetical protein JSV09_11955 [Thermoplasmata archaeon]